MKVLILKSVPNPAVRDPYSITLDTDYALRVIGHLKNQDGFCTSCAKDCIGCRKTDDLSLGSGIAGVIDFPATAPAIIEDPEEYLPSRVPDHDILLAIGIHEEILIAFLENYSIARGVIIPIERSNWLSPHGRGLIAKICGDRRLEVAFPKPFCSFAPRTGILLDFKNHFRIGKPEIRLTLSKETILRAEVLTSAPCGATYSSARGLTGRSVRENLGYVVSKQLSSYPCTADSSIDPEFGDSIMHEAAKIQRTMLPVAHQK